MTGRYAVIGDPVSHSLSPLMHNGWIADYGLDATYEAYQLISDDPVAAIRGLTQFAGMNVTVPHKEAAAKAADHGALRVANTLRWENDGSLSAFNTDGDGFIDALTEAVPDWRAHVSDALILGAGGAAEAVADALRPGPEHDIYITIANRTIERAEGLADRLTYAGVGNWSNLGALFERADLIVQTTTLGMIGSPSPDWPVRRCKREAILVDIVYRPLETPFLKAARVEGLTTVDGLGMLIHQGALAFEIWHRIKPDTAKARERLIAALA